MKIILRILMILAFLALMVSIQIIPVLRPWNASNPYSPVITLSCLEVLSILVNRAWVLGSAIIWKWYSSFALTPILVLMIGGSFLITRMRYPMKTK